MFDDFGDFELSVQLCFILKRVHVALWELRGFWERRDTRE